MRIGIVSSDIFEDRLFDRADLDLVALVECPLFDPLGPDQFRLHQNLQVLAGGRLADPELIGDQYAADAVLDQVAINLRRKIRARVLQPFQDLQPAVARQRPQRT